MKKLLTILLSILSLILVAQTPQKFNFQAVARDNSSGATLGNQILPTISVSISQNPDGSSAVYSENFTNIKTAPFGMFSLSIGTGTPVFGTFNTINWGSGPWYLRVQIGSPINFDVTTQLLSVPYALYAEESKIKFVDAAQGNTNHSSTTRGSWFSLTQAPLQVTVPATGTYLILAKLRAQGFTNNDRVDMVYSINGAAPTVAGFIIAPTGDAGSADIGNKAAEAHWITTLTKGQIVNLQAKIGNSGVSTSTVVFQDGEFSILKLQ